MVRVRSPQDLGAGLVFVTIGRGRNRVRAGPRDRLGGAHGAGLFPDAPELPDHRDRPGAGGARTCRERAADRADSSRPLFAILAAVLVFGALIDRVGLAITATLITIGAAYARREVNVKETLLLAAGLALFAVGIFVYALAQPLPAWWGR